MSDPIRIQLSRAKGWKMPPNTVKVDRTTKWGNPFKVTPKQDAKAVVGAFNSILRGPQSKVFDACKLPEGGIDALGGLRLLMYRNHLLSELEELRGKNLACWCKIGAPCHADVLLKLANKAPRPHRVRAKASARLSSASGIRRPTDVPASGTPKTEQR